MPHQSKSRRSLTVNVSSNGLKLIQRLLKKGRSSAKRVDMSTVKMKKI